MTAWVELRGSRVIVTICTFLVTEKINYRGVLGIRESRFEIAFQQILGHFQTKIQILLQKDFIIFV